MYIDLFVFVIAYVGSRMGCEEKQSHLKVEEEEIIDEELVTTDGGNNTDKEIDEEVITTDRIGNTDIETLLPKNLTGAGKTGENFPTN